MNVQTEANVTMGEETKKDLLVIAVTAHDPNREDDLKAQEAMDTAPDVSVQLSIMRKEKFEVLGRNVGWWLYVKHVDKEEKGYIPSTCVVPLKDDLTHEEEEELSHNVELTADLINPEVDLKFFPAAPVDKDVTNRGVCPEQNANIFSKLTFWWLNGLIYTGFKRPLVDEDLWALGKDNKSVNIVPKFMEKWAKEEKRCAIGKRCPLEDQQEQEQERDKLTEENDETKVEFVPKNDEKQSKDKKTDKKRPSLVRAMVYQFGPQFFIGMILKLIYDVIQFVQPQLVNLLVSYVADKTIPSDEKWKGYVYALSMFLVSVVMSLIIHQYWQIVFALGMRIRTAIIGMVYAKALALNSKARMESTAGEMVNLMSVDAQRLMDLVTYLNVLWSSPLVIVISMYFLFDVMGPSTLAGVGVLILLVPFNLIVTKFARKLQVKQMEAKDSRIKIINEIIAGIKRMV